MCNTRHDGHQAHVWPKTGLLRIPDVVVVNTAVANAKPVVNTVANKRKAGKYKDAEARKRYMREYMKKRRGSPK